MDKVNKKILLDCYATGKKLNNDLVVDRCVHTNLQPVRAC
jgi:hypothetical protein